MYIRQRGERDGKPVWLLRWEVRDPGTGKRRHKYETCHGTRTKAEDRWIERQAEIRRAGPGYVAPAKTPLRDHLQSWLIAAAPDWQPKTRANYADICRLYIAPYLGALRLQELTPVVVQQWIAQLLSKVGPRTVSLSRSTLRESIAWAVRSGILADNPIDKTRVPRSGDHSRRRVGAFTSEQAATLIATAYAGTRFGPFLEFQWLVGLRPGEALGLKWEAVDLEAGAISVYRSRVQLGGTMIDQERTKTSAGIRDLVLPKRAAEALRRQLIMQAEDRLRAGAAWPNTGLVFTTSTGTGILESNASRVFRRLRGRLGLPGHPLYGLRHTAASMQIAAGVPIEIVSKRLGHRNISVTVDTYGHLLPESNREAARRVDEFLAGGEDRRSKG